MKLCAVVDTNVLVAALLSKRDDSAVVRVIRAMLSGEFTPLYHKEILEEYEDVLHRAKFPIIPETADALIAHIIGNGMEASRINYEEAMPDEDDRVFLEVALSKEDSFLVTGNQKHYPTSARIITPSQFLEYFVK